MDMGWECLVRQEFLGMEVALLDGGILRDFLGAK